MKKVNKVDKTVNAGKELELFAKYLKSDSNEDAKGKYLYPIFIKLFGDIKTESDACDADVYIEGKLIVECKTTHKDWLQGFYQALHYNRKSGLTYSTIMIIAKKFVGMWRFDQIPRKAYELFHKSDVTKNASDTGKINAKKTDKILKREIQNKAIYWLTPEDLSDEMFGERTLINEVYQIKNILTKLDSVRLQVNPRNFINIIESLRKYFDKPIDAIHCFYTMVNYWDDASVIATKNDGEIVSLFGFKKHEYSDDIIAPKRLEEFKNFIEQRYVFTNHGSGLTADYYFSRFDEALAAIDEKFIKQHGIFFTDDDLSKFALWFVKNKFHQAFEEKYIVFDPAGGSGNLVSSWRGNLKHKIVSELQPDLLRVIEKRMKIDPFHTSTGFTIIPKTVTHEGLNFIKRPSKQYMKDIEKEISEKGIKFNKPFAFLLNPPYKNTDENIIKREEKEAHYEIDESILQLTGIDAGRERYLAFLGQILNIAKEQVEEYPDLRPAVMIFTPTSWLIPKTTFAQFRKIWDRHFEYHSGFLVTSNEWFKVQGRFPIAFTIWTYEENEKRKNKIKLIDYTHLSKSDFTENVNWYGKEADIEKGIKKIIRNSNSVIMDNRGDIRETLPLITRYREIKTGEDEFGDNEMETKEELIQQPRYDYSHAKKQKDENKLVSGFPLKFTKGHYELKRVCGNPSGEFVGFMDDNTPVRVNQDSCKRMSNEPDRVWFRLDTVFINLNQTKIFSGCADNRSYCANDIDSARATFSWFAITKALNGVYPIWANQYDIWKPEIPKLKHDYWYSLCFAFGLAENRCVVTKFEKDNPVKGAPEIYVYNPLCPIDNDSFWHTHLSKQIIKTPSLAKELVKTITDFYYYWDTNYCKGKVLNNVGLSDEPYFKHFSYRDYLTSHSGLVQIRKYAELRQIPELLDKFSIITETTRKVKEEIYDLLINTFHYFD